MSDGWLFYFVSIICLAAAVVLFSLDAACAYSNNDDVKKKKLPPLISLRRWILIVGIVLSATGLAMFITGLSVGRDAELVNRDTYYAIGGMTLAVSLCLLFIAVSLSTYHQVTVRVSLDEEEGEEGEPKLDPLEPQQSIELDPLEPFQTIKLDPLEPNDKEPKLDPLDTPRSNSGLLDPLEG